MSGSQPTCEKADRLDRILSWLLMAAFFFIPVATSPVIIAGILFLCVSIFSGKIFKERRRWLWQGWSLPVAVFMALPIVGLLWSGDHEAGIDFAKKSYYWLYAFAIASVCLTERSVESLLLAFCAGLAYICAYSLLQMAGVVAIVKKTPALIGQPSITVSLLLVFAMLMLSFYLPRTNGRRKAAAASFMVFFFLAFLASRSRTGYLAFIVLSPLIAYNLLGKKYFFKAAIVFAMIVSVMALTPTVRYNVEKAINDIRQYNKGDINTSLGLRLVLWRGAAGIFLENPVIGVGTGGFTKAMGKYEPPGLLPEYRGFSDPHSSVLYMAANFGIVGVLSYVWLFAVLIRNGWRHRESFTGFFILSSALVLLVGGLTSTQHLSSATAMLLAFAAGMQARLPAR